MRAHLYPGGTRVRLYPELFAGYDEPETAFLSPAPGRVLPGPADGQMYVVNPIDKPGPYAPPGYMPPYRGAEYPPALPDRGGHFDTVPLDSPQFLAVHLYGAARHTLDIWEHYLREKVRWWHAPEIPQLELVPVLDWANAHSGPGFLETGVMQNKYQQKHMFCMNFDVVAHEVGHAVLFATVGVPAPDRMTAQYLAFHESFSDLFGLIGVLRFESVISRLMAQTGGNLHALNMINRLGRYSDTEQVRVASNDKTMADVAGIRFWPDGHWTDSGGLNRNQHGLGEPLTGAIFDMLCEIFQNGLVSRGVVARGMDSRRYSPAAVVRSLSHLQHHHAQQRAQTPEVYNDALRDARDVVGYGMAHTMRTLHAATLSFDRVAACLLEAACALGETPHLDALLGLFLARGIEPRPFLQPVPGGVRFADPGGRQHLRQRPSPEAYFAAHRLIRHGHSVAADQSHRASPPPVLRGSVPGRNARAQ